MSDRYKVTYEGNLEYVKDLKEDELFLLPKNIASRLNEYEIKVKELESKCLEAFMAGQVDCGFDPSYSSALEWVKINEALCDG